MPELPEVETVARTLRPQVQGRCVDGVALFRRSSVHPLSLPLETLTGRTVVDAGRRGKVLLLRLEGPRADNLPDVLAVHLRMTGRLMVHPSDTPAGPHTRCRFALSLNGRDAGHLFFDDVRAFGVLFAGTDELLRRWDFWRTLGLEPLELDGAGLAACLKGRRTAVKAALLNQKVIAGIGNIYADEALFRAGIDPRSPADAVAREAAAPLLEALQGVLRLSIEQCGSSIRDYRDANGNVGAFQNSFAVYGRAGRPCSRCGASLARLRVAGRATVVCPRCQKML